MTSFCLEKRIDQADARSVCDVLADQTGLPKSRIKHAIACGAVWLQKPKGKKRRLRRAKSGVHINDRLFIYYNADILATNCPAGRCLHDFDAYSIWYKPPGLMSQGTLYGDHCSLLRQVEKHVAPKRKAYLVHRLDREAAGLMVLAHTAKAASRLSHLFQSRQVSKRYRIEVLGDLSTYATKGIIDAPLDEKPAVTLFETLGYEKDRNRSTVNVQLNTGRRHQIRRHFNDIGFPVVGDPRYGKGNKNETGMQLIAFSLSFVCPFRGVPVNVAIDPEGQLP